MMLTMLLLMVLVARMSQRHLLRSKKNCLIEVMMKFRLRKGKLALISNLAKMIWMRLKGLILIQSKKLLMK